MNTEQKLYNALMVLLNDGSVVEHLIEFDRMALRQAREAVIEHERNRFGREWQDFQDQQEEQYERRVCASYQARGQSNLY